jgi:DHA3 family tetracycline resistance protein-like MFS transporter
MRRLDAQRTWLLYRGVESFAFMLGWSLAPVFFVTELHMSPLELVLTGTALEIAYFLFEVPTAIVADTYSRRLSIVIGAFVMGLTFVATGLAPGVAIVLLAAAVMGFGWTFKSGAEDAWLADEVGVENVAAPYSAAPRSRGRPRWPASWQRSGSRSSTCAFRSSRAASRWSSSACCWRC